MSKEPYRIYLDKLCDRSDEIEIDDDDKLVIFSDLHMGNRRSGDDFKRNAPVFISALRDYYLKNDYSLILNGDIEELHRYALHTIRERWNDIYSLFDRFAGRGKLYKVFGNHDSKLFSLPDQHLRYPLREALKLVYKGRQLFLFHGHQVSLIYQRFNNLIGLLLRYIAKPLRIKHYSVAHDKRKQFTIEQRLYEFARERGIVSIIGHTHRPLFESMSKVDTINYKIERNLRYLEKADEADKAEIEDNIKGLKKEIDRQLDKKGKEVSLSTLYSTHTIVPCVFNSGCAIGKRGMTAIEIQGGNISLVHWYDKNIDEKYNREDTHNTTQIPGTEYFRTVLKQDSLDYIFTRIRLLR
jgi:UDP-2,3-diacylglucosamine pyrophosphatase LpxH